MSKRVHQDYSPAMRRATVVILRPVLRTLLKRDWHGQEHIPRSGGVIVAGNHLSYADWAAMALFVHQAGRYPAFLIKSSAFNVKGLGPFLRACGQFPVNRGSADAALVLKDAERAVEHGECLIFYPEGTATRDPNLWPMVPKTGIARLALATGAPVIPVACWGTQDILPYGSKKPHLVPRHTVKMLAGPPVDLSAYAGQPLSRDVLRATADMVMADITGLLARLRGESPPAHLYNLAAARREARQEKTARERAPSGGGYGAGAGAERGDGKNTAGAGAARGREEQSGGGRGARGREEHSAGAGEAETLQNDPDGGDPQKAMPA